MSSPSTLTLSPPLDSSALSSSFTSALGQFNSRPVRQLQAEDYQAPLEDFLTLLLEVEPESLASSSTGASPATPFENSEDDVDLSLRILGGTWRRIPKERRPSWSKLIQKAISGITPDALESTDSEDKVDILENLTAVLKDAKPAPSHRRQKTFPNGEPFFN